MKIGIVSVPVSNQQRAKDFFCDKLGFTVVRDNDFMGDNQRWIELRPTGAETSIVLTTWLDMSAGSLKGTVILVDDIRHTVETLRSRGLTVPPVEVADWGSYVQINDSEGNGWVIQETAPNA
jgi:catechol 2,3-dioxygenase-like lactoylglutathione lyase family enzyme